MIVLVKNNQYYNVSFEAFTQNKDNATWFDSIQEIMRIIRVKNLPYDFLQDLILEEELYSLSIKGTKYILDTFFNKKLAELELNKKAPIFEIVTLIRRSQSNELRDIFPKRK